MVDSSAGFITRLVIGFLPAFAAELSLPLRPRSTEASAARRLLLLISSYFFFSIMRCRLGHRLGAPLIEVVDLPAMSAWPLLDVVSALVIFSSILDWIRSSILTESAGLLFIICVLMFWGLLLRLAVMPEEIRWAGWLLVVARFRLW